MRRLMNGLRWCVFALWFSVLSGCSIGRLRRIWRDLVERDIHPADMLLITWENGREMELSAYGSQVCGIYPGCTACEGTGYKDGGKVEGGCRSGEVCRFCKGQPGFYQFTVNWREESGLYVHEKRVKDGDWVLAFRENDRILRSIVWVQTMRLLAENMAQVEDRSEESMVPA